MVYCAGKLIENLKLFYKSNRPHFLWVYRRDNPGGDVGRTLEKLVNHEPSIRLRLDYLRKRDKRAFFLNTKEVRISLIYKFRVYRATTIQLSESRAN